MKALCVRQPWAWLLFNGKTVENRDWYTAYKGPLAIVASKGMTRGEYADAVDFVRAFNPRLAALIPLRDELVGGSRGEVARHGAALARHSGRIQRGHSPVSTAMARLPVTHPMVLWRIQKAATRRFQKANRQAVACALVAGERLTLHELCEAIPLPADECGRALDQLRVQGVVEVEDGRWYLLTRAS